MLALFSLSQMKSSRYAEHDDDWTYGVRGSRAKPCRACTDFQTWAQQRSDKTVVAKDAPDGCPLDKDSLGRNTWSLMHTMAAYYPEKPSEEQQKQMSTFIHLFSQFYPCEHCAQDFRKDIETCPPQTQSRTALSQWWCRVHNIVNEKLGKPAFDCSRVDQRWLDGPPDGSCDR